MEIKKLNFKQPKYIIPLIVLPFVMFFGYQGNQMLSKDDKKEIKKDELSTSLGETQDSILSKNEAYDQFFEKKDDRTMLDGLDKENDSMNIYSDNLDTKQKRYIDSLNYVRKQQEKRDNEMRKSYYNPTAPKYSNDDKDYKRSTDIIRMLNDGGSGKTSQDNIDKKYDSRTTDNYYKKDNSENDPVKNLKKQMLMMDSLEKSRDPKFQAQYKAEQTLKKNKEKMEKFLNSSLTVKKAGISNEFNTISVKKEPNYVKAVIDEDIKGYLGSRIRFRLLEDVQAGRYVIPKGTILYGQISGFTLQRVNLNVVSVLVDGNILPINLSVFDIDGMQGLYVPASAFREMMRELGTNSVQGTTLESGSESFFTSMASNLFSSASQTISNIIRKNKAKLKYNTYIYLINEKELKENENK
jgi:conjugative transposon TraM protein